MLQVLRRLLRRRAGTVDLLRERLQRFHDLVGKNNRMLELIAEAGEMLGGEYVFDIQYLRKMALDAKLACQGVVDDLNLITDGRYPRLLDIVNQLSAEIDAIVEGKVIAAPAEYVLRLDRIDETLIDVVGAKMARLGGIRNRLELPVPDGFVISSYACQVFLQENGISDEVEAAFAVPGPYDAAFLAERSHRLGVRVREARLPRPLTRAIERAVKHLVRRSGCRSLAVRSSAYGEDGELSFAGQFATRLGVAPEGVLEAYREVVASMFSEQVMTYRQSRGLHPARGLMAVGCLCMVPARAAGVLYTLDPESPRQKSMQVSVVHGLGQPVVEGSAAVDRYTLARTGNHAIIQRQVAHKTHKLTVTASSGALELVPLSEPAAGAPALSDDELRRLAGIGLSIERSMKCVADIEWAVCEDGSFSILQARPLRIRRSPRRDRELAAVVGRYPAIMKDQGEVACSGVACGRVVVVEDASSLEVAKGCVLVAHTSTPRLSAAVPHASAVITDVGTTTSHLATIAREYRVPTIVDAGNARKVLAGVDVVTVDADANVVYRGRVDELLHRHLLRASAFEDTNEFRMLRRILRRVAPLNLRDPQSRSFTAERCSTYHDVIRFAHEKAVQELAEGGWLEPSHGSRSVYRLDLSLPLDLVLIDLGGGLSGECIGRKRVDTASITSVPLRALMAGLTTDGVWETEPISMDPNAFMASATRAAPWLSTVSSRPRNNLAIISAQYLNLNLHLGFHFNIVDCFVGESRNDNYIYFRFAGGVTELRRRARRALLLMKILESYDFVVESRGDLVIARIKKLSHEAILSRMEMVGRLIGFSRQLDIVLNTEETVDAYLAKFLGGSSGEATAPPAEQSNRRTA